MKVFNTVVVFFLVRNISSTDRKIRIIQYRMVSEYIITSATLKYVSRHVVLSAEVLYRVVPQII